MQVIVAEWFKCYVSLAALSCRSRAKLSLVPTTKTFLTWMGFKLWMSHLDSRQWKSPERGEKKVQSAARQAAVFSLHSSSSPCGAGHPSQLVIPFTEKSSEISLNINEKVLKCWSWKSGTVCIIWEYWCHTFRLQEQWFVNWDGSIFDSNSFTV